MSFLAKIAARAKECKRAYTKLRDPWWRAKFRYAAFFEQAVLDERLILLESQHGKTFDGNIFQIARYLATEPAYADFRIVVSAWGRERKRFRAKLARYGLERRVRLATMSSDDYFRVLSSAKWVVNDNTFLPFYMKQKGQVYLNTWHGTPLKTLGRRIQGEHHAIGNAQRNFFAADYLLFPNDYTREHICADYMLENLAPGQAVLSGYPRNEVFFDDAARAKTRARLKLDGKRVYAYMPTFRGVAAKGRTAKNDIYLQYFLYELDRQLTDDEWLYVNLHPVAQSAEDFRLYRHIRPFPADCETYAFLNVADVLVTDYSSVFFDFACTRRKIVLFTYDKEDYLRDRGTYLDLETLPFPQVRTPDALVEALRADKTYDDGAFVARFCPYDGRGATQRLCDAIFLGKETGVRMEPIPDNGKENVLLYGGNLAPNGITRSLNALLNTLDTTKRNYYVTCEQGKVWRYRDALLALPPNVGWYVHTGDLNLTLKERILRKAFKWKWLPARAYATCCGAALRRELRRMYADIRIDGLIHFNGYEAENILLFAAFQGNNAIFVHSDMVAEIKTRGNQRKDVLAYAYNAYDHVAIATEDLRGPTAKIAGGDARFTVVRNAILHETIRAQGAEPWAFDDFTKSTLPEERLHERLREATYRFVAVGRFSPEKGFARLVDAFARFHEAERGTLLLIIGGSSFRDCRDRLTRQVKARGLTDSVVLIERMSNPYALMAACDGFILSSLYEGFGLVLTEADILGLPVVSTDIVGPRTFMLEHGGTLVENSEAGLFQGLSLLASGKVPRLNVDYWAYNENVRQAFECLLRKQ